jgi:SulP family sulfate permease
MNLRSYPLSSTVVMLATVVVVVGTGDLSKGVLVGVLLSGVFFAAKVARLMSVEAQRSEDGQVVTYVVTGQVFFASSNSLTDAIDYQDVPARVRIDVSQAHFWDVTAIGALDAIVLKLRRHNAEVEIIGLNEASATMVERFASHHRPGEPKKVVH